MKLALDARMVHSAARRGIGKSIAELYNRLSAMKPDWRFVMFHRGMEVDDPFAGMPNVESRKIEMPGDRWGLWQRVRLPLAAKTAGSDVLHCPANTGPGGPLVPMLLTIHDLIPLQAEFLTESSRRWGRQVAVAARKARRVTTGSEYVKAELIRTLGIPAEKITVHYWGPNPNCRPLADPARGVHVRKKYGLGEDLPYVLAFGGEDPRKNTERVLRAWECLPHRLQRANCLVVVGVQEPMLTRLREQCRSAGMGETCVLHGYVAEEDLAILLGGALLLCHPSLSEGFGLPVVDAFASQTPVLTSNLTSIPEIAGEAAYYVDAHAERDIAEGLRFLIQDAGARSELIARGRKRLELFTWDQCARSVCEAVESVA